MKLPIDEYKKKHPENVKKATVIAFVVSRGSIVSVGFNRRRFSADGKFTYHAEENSLKKAGRRAKGAELYVIRIKKDGSRGLARPCNGCQDIINKSGISKVWFSLDASDRWGKLIWMGDQWVWYE
jgi:pyrimidine deaminase RibD-like protein